MTTQSSSSDDGSLNIAFFSVLIVSLFLLFIFSEGEALPKESSPKMAVLSSLEKELKELPPKNDITLYDSALLLKSPPTYHKPQVLATEKEEVVARKVMAKISAYAPLDPNAREGMCFSGNPAITASGTYAREGIVATNMFPFGTRIRIPSVFGNRVFVVEDTMSSIRNNTVDIFFVSQRDAINFGTTRAYVEILN